MSKIIATLIAGAVIAGGLLVPVDPAFAAKKNKKAAATKPAAAATVKGASKGVTNIADCAKMDPAQRDACISRSAPVKGADLYKAAGGAAAATAAAPTVTKGAKAAKAEKPAKAQKGAAGTTNIDDCSKMQGGARDACISRSAPVKGADLYTKYKK